MRRKSVTGVSASTVGTTFHDLRHDAAGFIARMQRALAVTKQTMAASFVGRRVSFEKALWQQEAATGTYEKAVCTMQQALTDFGSAYRKAKN